MKSYKEIADNVLKRRDEYLNARKRRRMNLIRTASSVMGTAAAAFIGLMIYNNDTLQNIKPDIYSSRYNTTESIATSPAQPTQTEKTEKEEIVTTEVRQTDNEHSHITTEKPDVTTTAPKETKSSMVKKTTHVTETKKTSIATVTKKTSLKTTLAETETKPAVQTQSLPATELIPTTAITYATDEPGGGTGEFPMETGPPGELPTTYTSTAVTTIPLLTETTTNTTTTACTTFMVTTDLTAKPECSSTETTTTPIPEAPFPNENAEVYTSEVIYYNKFRQLKPPD